MVVFSSANMSDYASVYRAGKRRRWLVLFALAVLGALGALFFFFDEPLPPGEPGPRADALARRMAAAVNTDAWERTGAVRWTFAGRHEHLWDRQRHLARVRWDDIEVLVDLDSRRGLAYRAGMRLPPDEEIEQVETAWSYWVNDAFWLNPLAKLFDAGTTRQWVPQADGSAALLVSYASGGATPGDSYLWFPDAQGRPRAWQMWVSILPVGGVRTSWEEWVTLATGAHISTRHRIAFFTLEIGDVAGAAALEDLALGPDPFVPLLQELGGEMR
jgi:hypothetical protein